MINRFVIFVTIRVALVSLTAIILGESLHRTSSQAISIFLLILIVFQTWSLVKYVTITNRNLKSFLVSLKFLDRVNNTFPEEESFRDLNLTFNEIIDVVKEAKLAAESERHYFQSTLDHVDVGILTLDPKGRVDIINLAGRNLLGVKRLRYLTDIKATNPVLFDAIQKLTEGDVATISIERNGSPIKLSLRATEINILGATKKVISFQNIQTELDQGELDAWKRLIRVLTHEILNSVTPIKSLSGTIKKMLASESADISEDQKKKAIHGLEIISKQSSHLADFISSYKKLAKLPSPVLSDFYVRESFENTITLLSANIEEYLIDIEFSVKPDNLAVRADSSMIQQVLINLINNSIDALKGVPKPKIVLNAYSNENSICIDITDNGRGIGTEAVDQVFIPYFSTKPEGMGIGLSLSKQIMQLHGGTMSIIDQNDIVGTTIRLTFNVARDTRA